MVDPAGVTRTIRVFLLDDHEIVRRGVTDLLEATPDVEVVGDAATAAGALARIPACRPDVALLDARLPDGSGIDVCREIRSRHPEVRCLVLTSFDDEEAVVSAVLAGASGYLLKEVRGAALVDAVRQVAAGRSLLDPAVTEKLLDRLRRPAAQESPLSVLSEREREILDLVADGLSNREIAERLYLAEKTVRNYVSNVLSKLDLRRRTQAAVLAHELRGRTPPPRP